MRLPKFYDMFLSMNKPTNSKFILPNPYLSSLPTGAVKNIVNTLGARIASGDFAAGDIIPTEPDLSTKFGVSRTVIREAVKVLSGKGMIRTARRYGTRVCHFEEWNLLDPDVIRWHDPDSPTAARIYADCTEMRFIVEPQAAGLAAVNATKAQRETIVLAAECITPSETDPDAMIAADYAFHATILEASGNILLSQLQGPIQAMLQFSYPTGSLVDPDEKVSQEWHLRVAAAIHDGDADKSRHLMHEMLQTNRKIADKMR